VRKIIEQKSSVTISGGVAAALEGESREQLLERADAALYAAKQRGRNLVVVHDGENVETTAALFADVDTAPLPPAAPMRDETCEQTS
jgi:predicted signal transduction protein with EAL and GGDEF domain